MLYPRLKRGLFTLTAAGLLAAVATAQPYPEVKRDPFVSHDNPAVQQPINRPKPLHDTRVVSTPVTPSQNMDKPDAPVPVTPPVAIVVPAPDVTVSGIVASAGQRQAIINTGSRSVIVTAGQQVADYRVKAIDAQSVTFEPHGKSFKIPLGQKG